MTMETDQQPQKKGPGAHGFKPGMPRPEGSGRQPGSQNRYTRILKEALIIAAEEEGSDGKGKDGLTGFLRHLARTDIRAFAMLLGRAMPLQFEGRGEMQVKVTYRTIEEVRVELESRGIDMEMVQKLMYDPPEKLADHLK